jgi:signal transduction histidine kinase
MDVVVDVSDTGIGISAELLPRIFEMFTQGVRPIDRAEGGLGLGLALVQSLVKLHGGSVTADSGGSGKGSRFTVRLPALDVTPVVSAGADRAAHRNAAGTAPQKSTHPDRGR